MRSPTEGDSVIEPKRWGALLDPDRKCGSKRWLFPGDTLIANPWRKDTASMLRGVRSIIIVGHVLDPVRTKKSTASLDPNETIVRVHVHHNGETLLTHTLTRNDLNGQALQFAVEPTVFPSQEPVFLEFESEPTAPFTIISSAAVSEQQVASSNQAVNE